ncbi:co-chaperone GroES [Candidatus Parcubacteria bacterium]|nr:MAG: co-chaperone GroES [Candidatus Parcubacteria bacterium]
MKFNPINDHIVIEPIKEEQKTKTGIVLPDTAEKEKPEQGRVVAVGPGKLTDSGNRLPMSLKVGDIVLFTKYGPNEIKVKDASGKEVEYLIAKEDDILAVIEK